MFNEERDSDRFEDLEGLLGRWAGGRERIYTIALFDCSRDFIFFPKSEPKTKKENKPEEVIDEKKQNLLIIFGCKRSKKLDAYS